MRVIDQYGLIKVFRSTPMQPMQALFDDPARVIDPRSVCCHQAVDIHGLAVAVSDPAAAKWSLLGGYVKCYPTRSASLLSPMYQRLYNAIHPDMRYGNGTLGGYLCFSQVGVPEIINLVRDAGV